MCTVGNFPEAAPTKTSLQNQSNHTRVRRRQTKIKDGAHYGQWINAVSHPSQTIRYGEYTLHSNCSKQDQTQNLWKAQGADSIWKPTPS